MSSNWWGAALAVAIACCGLFPAAAVSEQRSVEPRVRLPGRAAHTAAPARWILGVRTPSGVRPVVVPRSRARLLATRLRREGRLLYAEPNVVLHAASAFESAPDGWARGAVVSSATRLPAFTWPIAVVDDFVAPDLAEFAGNQINWLEPDGRAVAGWHGTAVASVAAAVAGNGGLLGVAPGNPLISYQPRSMYCSDIAAGVLAASRAGARVINLSLGSPDFCFTLYRAVSLAVGVGAVVVAAAGNEYQEGNPVIYPAGFPHVLSVAATGQDGKSAYFSSSNAAVDISAPGVDIPVVIPPGDDPDGTRDGITLVDGTSFAAPMVAGAAAWIGAARTDLSADQVADVLRRGARDLARTGWDRDTGFGLLDLNASLLEPAPPVDPGEPNDTISFVDGSSFASPDAYIFQASRGTVFSATVDEVEDPADVYRIRLPGRSAVQITVRPRSGDPDLAVYSSSVRYVGDARALIARSRRGGLRTDRLRIYNNARSARRAYVVIEPYAKNYQDAGYQLSVRRVRY